MKDKIKQIKYSRLSFKDKLKINIIDDTYSLVINYNLTNYFKNSELIFQVKRDNGVIRSVWVNRDIIKKLISINNYTLGDSFALCKSLLSDMLCTTNFYLSTELTTEGDLQTWTDL